MQVEMRASAIRLIKESPALVLLLYILFVFVGAALIAPFVAWALEGLAVHISFFQEELTNIPFHRIVNRCLIFLALAGLWPMFRGLNVASLNALGWNFSKGVPKQLFLGFLYGFPALLIALMINIGVGSAHLTTEFRSFNDSIDIICGALVSAVFVAALEETLFRGALITALKRAYGLKRALLLSSAVYAITHFFAKPVDPEVVRLWSGFTVLTQMFKGFICWQVVIPGFLNLFAAGLLLALLFQRLEGLLPSIAAHGSWVFLLKTQCLFVSYTSSPYSWFFGTSRLIDGWMSLILLCGFVFLAHKFLPVCREQRHF
ncbi:MAG: CPBP family intramembrane metalloprotease [Verrucomicrobiae bacterium]|nr:CPBP family intramembrane metalloprotease [Verrucomicrobiae bacterium]